MLDSVNTGVARVFINQSRIEKVLHILMHIKLIRRCIRKHKNLKIKQPNWINKRHRGLKWLKISTTVLKYVVNNIHMST